MSSAAGLNVLHVCVCLCMYMCEVHATDGIQGIVCCVKHRENFSEDKSWVVKPAAWLWGWERYTEKNFKHSTNREFNQRIVVINTQQTCCSSSDVVCFLKDYVGASYILNIKSSTREIEDPWFVYLNLTIVSGVTPFYFPAHCAAFKALMPAVTRYEF